MDKGLIIINTGDGKGKSTAAFGTAFRALGHGWKVCVIQFIKSPSEYGEVISAEKFPNLEWYTEGRGFTWNSDDLEKDKAVSQKGFELAKQKIGSDKYDLIILDEITYLTNYKFIDIEDLLKVLKNKPCRLNIILTGRNADPKLIEIADTVTEMKKIRHCFDKEIKAKKGIEF
ncbi:MAG TPA: cob(I)yrinic acid a,c-diamide adenosyltransferase [Clostridiales bacterium]|nr:cob(I)yrinic acid a,c-diamide adenosyltransferase [Clostridiales bacterium]HQP68865.1 cob(I)yrinic acid a,c-diamide adenosyltransferase [Clostridiales bacterium]